MKLKYNFNGQTETVPFSTRKPQGKRLVIHHNDQNHYAKVVPTDDPHASNLPVGINGEIFAAQSMPPPEIYEVNVAPSAVAVMQGQSAVATVTAVANEAVAGLSYSLTNPPTWITISDDLILIQPSDNDLGVANVEVIARDTVSDVSLSAALLAEAKLRPIIESLSVIPPTVSAIQGESTTATISAVTNEAVTGLSFALDGEPSWMNLNGSVILMTPTQNDSGSAAVTVLARDSNSSASAATIFNAEVKEAPQIISFTTNPANIASLCLTAEYTKTVTLQAEGNEAVEDIIYSSPDSNVTISGNRATIKAPSSVNVGEQFTLTFTARDLTGIAEKTIQQIAYRYQYPEITATPNKIDAKTGSGRDTITINYTSDSSATIFYSNAVPINATVTGAETLNSAAQTVRGAVTIIYPVI